VEEDSAGRGDAEGLQSRRTHEWEEEGVAKEGEGRVEANESSRGRRKGGGKGRR
jgi:hypothetical protein